MKKLKFSMEVDTAEMKELARDFLNVTNAADTFLSVLNNIRSTAAITFAPLLSLAIPQLQSLTSWLESASWAVAQFAAAFAGLPGVKRRIKDNESLARSYRSAGSAAREASKDILAFDEINRLTDDSRSGSGGGGGAAAAEDDDLWEIIPLDETSFPARLGFAVKDVLFTWDDLTPEQIAEKALAGILMLGGAVTGGLIGGLPGVIIGALAGLALGIVLDATIFNFDGELSQEELLKALGAALAVGAGAVTSFILGGPFGAVLGLTLGSVLSFALAGIDFESVRNGINEWFANLKTSFQTRWENFRLSVSTLWQNFQSWWQNLHLGNFSVKLPHLGVYYEALNPNGILAKHLGITAIPHLYVDWYAKGGIVNNATLIGAGEAGKEAIIPLERNTEWIHRLAEQLLEELQSLQPAQSFLNFSLPDVATGALVPAAAAGLTGFEPTGLSAIVDSLRSLVEEMQNGAANENLSVKIYLDGKQLESRITKLQRDRSRASGV